MWLWRRHCRSDQWRIQWQLHKIGEDRTERLDIVPAQLRVIVTVRPKYACRACTDGVTQAPAPGHLIEGGLPTEGAMAHVPPLGDAKHHLPGDGSANMPIIFHYTDRAKLSPGPASISIAAPWPTGSAWPHSTLGRLLTGWRNT